MIEPTELDVEELFAKENDPYEKFHLGEKELRSLAMKSLLAAIVGAIVWFFLAVVLIAVPEKWTLVRLLLGGAEFLGRVAFSFGLPAWVACEVWAFGIGFRNKVIRGGDK